MRGTLMPSSRFLVKRMLSKINFDHDRDILQLGYGNGVFTKELLLRMNHTSTLTIFEIDPWCEQYRIDDTRIRYIEDTAEKVSSYCGDRKFDTIISTLPFASLPQRMCENIFHEIRHHLAMKWKFLQFQYSLYSRKTIYGLFHIEPKIDFEFRNLPPAFIYEVVRTQ